VPRTLVRFLRLPAAEGRKLRGMLELEARAQIPFPLEEVCWETHLVPRSPSTPRFEPLQVLLLAARRRDIDDRVAQFGQAGIPVHVVQCDAVAVHNLVQFDRGDQQASETCDQTPTGVAVLDIGTEMTNVIWSFPGFVWFRGFRPATDDVVSALVGRFQLTHEAAEQLARNPSRADQYQDVQDTFREVFRKLIAQYEGCQLEFRKNMSPGAPREMLVAGGGARIPGLLRYLRHGR
jgi:type IV pilus assembly protein PilM